LLQLICTAYCYCQHTVIVVCGGDLFVAVYMHSLLLLAAYCYCCVCGRAVCCSLYAQPTVIGSILLLFCVWESCLLQLQLCVGQAFCAYHE